MATVTLPDGSVQEGVTGELLAYYRSEGYKINEAPETAFPLVYNGDTYVDGNGNPVPHDDPAAADTVGEPVADVAQPVAEPAPIADESPVVDPTTTVA